MGGVARKNFRLFRKICGDSTMSSVIIATNMWSEVTPEKGAKRERELSTSDLFFKPALERGAKMVRHDNTVESAHAIIGNLVEKEAVTLAVQHEMVHERKTVPQTSAGMDLQAELNEQMSRHRQEMKEMQQKMELLMLEKDFKHQTELQELNDAVTDVREQMRKVQSHSNKLQDEREAERKRLEEEAKEMSRSMQEREDKLRDLYTFAESQKEMLAEMKDAITAVQRQANEHAAERLNAEEKLKDAQDTHKAELGVLRQEFEDKLAAALASASTQKKTTDGPSSPTIGPRPRTKSQTGGHRRGPPGFFSGLALVLDQLFVPQIPV